jgi:hypothetical protein
MAKIGRICTGVTPLIEKESLLSEQIRSRATQAFSKKADRNPVV